MLAGTIVAVAGFAVTGHVVTAEPHWLTAPALALHVFCDAFWAGALVPLYRRLGIDSSATSARIVTRFSRQVIYVVTVLIGCGLIIAVVQVGTPAKLVETAYGRRLLAKLFMVAALLTLAALNKMRLTPALGRGEPGVARRLRGSIAAELVLVGGILVLTAMLGQQIPPRALAEESHEHHHHPEVAPKGADMVMTSGGRSASLDVLPARPGSNRLALALTDEDGTPMAPIELSVRLSSTALGIEASEYKGTKVAAGHYVADVDLPIAGVWNVEVDALITDFERVVFTTTIPIR